MNGISRMEVSENIALISLKKIPHDLTFLAEIFAGFAAHGIVLDMISQTSPLGGNVSVSFTCPDQDIVKAVAISKDLRAKYPDMQPLVSSGNCKLELYGEEMRTEHGVFAHVLACLCGSGADLLQVSTSETSIGLLVPACNLETAQAAIAAEFAL